jgi:hypothetical protein
MPKPSLEQRTVKELAGNARLNWELEWAEIPVRDKAQFFQVVSQYQYCYRTE